MKECSYYYSNKNTSGSGVEEQVVVVRCSTKINSIATYQNILARCSDLTYHSVYTCSFLLLEQILFVEDFRQQCLPPTLTSNKGEHFRLKEF